MPAAQTITAHVPNHSFDVEKIRNDFPILSRQVHGNRLVYLDNASSSQKPAKVIETLRKYYEQEHANIHRGVHFLSAEGTEKYEAVREKVRDFIHAAKSEEIIFTKGTTEAINLVAGSFGKKFIGRGDEVVVSALEHHSNIVPWQIMCEERGASLRVIPINDRGELLLDEFHKLLSEKARLVAIAHVSNTLGTINPVKEITAAAHERNIPVLLDGAQAAPHLKIDVADIGCDFYSFSSHKMYGPTGVGVLYGKEKWLEAMPPYQGGGDMIRTVSFEKTTYNELPHKFEAGTPNIADVIGLGAAIDYIRSLGQDNITRHEDEILRYATQKLSQKEGIRIYGTAKNKAAVISFLIGNIHPYDTGTILDRLGIAVRTGHHCTEPLMKRYNIPGTVRASFAVYNTKQEVDLLVEGIERVKGMF